MKKRQLKSKSYYKPNEIRTNKAGDKTWFRNGVVHREGLPAIIMVDGSKEWLENGDFHRVDEPARVFANGDKSWYLHGEKLTEAQFNERVFEASSYD
tara:strand:+ start:443 stop:733 length:291 start_codon:yes stop_codon:yes gene_type:complete